MSNLAKFAITFWAALLIAMAGCSSEEIQTGSNEFNEGEVELAFRLSIPDPDVKETATRAQTLGETRITTADVLVFSIKTGQTDYTFDYHARGTVSSTSNPVSEFKAKLASSTNPVKLYLLANASAAVTGNATLLQPGATEAAVKSNLSMAFTPTTTANNVPMWGEYVFAGGITPQYSRQINGITMYRAVAKITVQSNLPATQFEITGIYVARGRSNIVLPAKNIDNTGRITEPNVPATGTYTVLDPISITPVISSFYVAEDTGFGKADVFATNSGSDKHTTLIISAKTGGVESFYRLDIQHDDVYGRIIRNNHYRVAIAGVSGPGAATLQAALNVKTPTLLYDTRNFALTTGLRTIVFDAVEQLSAEARQILLMPQNGVRDIPISAGEINTGVQIARYVPNQPINENDFGQDAQLPAIGGYAEIALVGNSPVLRVTSNQNAGTTDLFENIVLRTPTKMLNLQIVKKSFTTLNIAASVQGALTNTHKAVFTHGGGTKIVNVSSSTAWQIEASADWVRVRKLSDTQFEITTVKPQGASARETSLAIKNEMGQTAFIEIYQEYQLEWSNAYTIGGIHTDELNYFVAGTSPIKHRRFTPPTVSGTKPLGFAAAAGDVRNIMPKERISPDYPTTAQLIYPNGENPEMAGDFYSSAAPSEQTCPSGWRLPYQSEIQTLGENLVWGTNAPYIIQNGVKIYFPPTGSSSITVLSGTYSIRAQLTEDSHWQQGDVHVYLSFVIMSNVRHGIPTITGGYYNPSPTVQGYNTVRCVR